jgi:uncharacterized protein YuzE
VVDFPAMQYDKEAGAVYVYIRRTGVARTETFGQVVVDYDRENNIVGVEIYGIPETQSLKG